MIVTISGRLRLLKNRNFSDQIDLAIFNLKAKIITEGTVSMICDN